MELDMKKYNVCIVGAGAVGKEMIRLLRKRNFPAQSIVILARSAREEIIDGESYQVKETTAEAFDGMDFAFFAGTEGAKGASQTWGWIAVEKGCVVIDNGDDFRMDDRVPLVIPEINPSASSMSWPLPTRRYPAAVRVQSASWRNRRRPGRRVRR